MLIELDDVLHCIDELECSLYKKRIDPEIRKHLGDLVDDYIYIKTSSIHLIREKIKEMVKEKYDKAENSNN